MAKQKQEFWTVRESHDCAHAARTPHVGGTWKLALDPIGASQVGLRKQTKPPVNTQSRQSKYNLKATMQAGADKKRARVI